MINRYTSPSKKGRALAMAAALTVGVFGASAHESDASARKHTPIEKVCKSQKLDNGKFERCKFMAGTFMKKMVTTSERTYQSESVDIIGRRTVDVVTTEHLKRYNRAGKVILSKDSWASKRYLIAAVSLPPVKPVKVMPTSSNDKTPSTPVPTTPDQAPNDTMPSLSPLPSDQISDSDLTGVCYDSISGDEAKCAPAIERAELDCFMSSTEAQPMAWTNPTAANPNGQCIPFDPSAYGL